MSKITSDILAKLAPSTPAPLRDRFLPFLNEAMPRYDIGTAPRVRAFLTTTVFESQWLQKTREGKARPNTKAGRAQAKYWPTGYFGRGLIQTTHEENYQQFADWCVDQGLITDDSEIMDNPALLEQPKWAVESACFFWQKNNLNQWADKGDITDVESVVNTGKPHHTAWGEADREALYKKACKVIPDDFTFDSAVASTEQEAAAPVAEGGITSPAEQPPIPDAKPGDAVIEKEADPPGFLAKIKIKLAGWGVTIGGLTGIQQYKQSFDSLGIPIPPTVMEYVILLVLICFIGWLFFEAVKHFIVDPIRKRMLTTSLITANTTPTNQVLVACPENLWQYAALGYKVVTRQ